MLNIDEKENIRLGDAFRAHIDAKDFPCIGAKAALARGTLETLICNDITSAWNDLLIHEHLLGFSQEYRRDPSLVRSLAVIFAKPSKLSEMQFEKHMWFRLQSLADKYEWRAQGYARTVGVDTTDAHFGLSFGGEAYFVAGMHPDASRPARRFERPAMVFNLHDQFEQLRLDNRYDRLRETVTDRDASFAGDTNPMLSQNSAASEAAQYSGRTVDKDQQCPFEDKHP